MASKGPVRASLNVQWEGGHRIEEIEIDRAEWDAMSPDERAKMLDQESTSHAADYVGWGWHIADPDDLAATE